MVYILLWCHQVCGFVLCWEIAQLPLTILQLEIIVFGEQIYRLNSAIRWLKRPECSNCILGPHEIVSQDSLAPGWVTDSQSCVRSPQWSFWCPTSPGVPEPQDLHLTTGKVLFCWLVFVGLFVSEITGKQLQLSAFNFQHSLAMILESCFWSLGWTKTKYTSLVMKHNRNCTVCVGVWYSPPGGSSLQWAQILLHCQRCFACRDLFVRACDAVCVGYFQLLSSKSLDWCPKAVSRIFDNCLSLKLFLSLASLMQTSCCLTVDCVECRILRNVDGENVSYVMGSVYQLCSLCLRHPGDSSSWR